jgi:hypothetical protein
MRLIKPILLILLATFALASNAKAEPLDTPLASPDTNTFGFFSTSTTFIKLDFAARDIGCGSEGDVCAVGIDKLLYCYDLVNDKWDHIPTNEEIGDIIAVDVDDDGRIYILTICATFVFECDNRWHKLPGTGRDIGVGVNFDVWKVGNDKETPFTGNYGVWKLFCECDCNCICSRICIRFRKISFSVCDPIVKKRCHWFRADVYGVAIDVFPNGDAALVKANGKVYIVNAITFEAVEVVASNSSSINAVDVTVGNDGVIIVTTVNGDLYRYNAVDKVWVKISLATVPGVRI